MSIRMSLNTAPSPFGQRPVSQGRCDSTSPLRNRISLVLQNCAFSLCLCGWRSTQQEPEDDDVTHQQERYVQGRDEPGNTKVEKWQANYRSLVYGEQQVSDPHKVEQPDKRERNPGRNRSAKTASKAKPVVRRSP